MAEVGTAAVMGAPAVMVVVGVTEVVAGIVVDTPQEETGVADTCKAGTVQAATVQVDMLEADTLLVASIWAVAPSAEGLLVVVTWGA